MNPNTYHLPLGSYWACNHSYNGLSQLSRFSTSIRLSNVRRKQLRNHKISSSIAQRLIQNKL